jgi:glyoxylate reductase
LNFLLFLPIAIAIGYYQKIESFIMTKPLVIISHALPEDWIASLVKDCDVLIGPEGNIGLSSELQNQLHRVEGLFSLLTDPIDKGIIENAPKLRVISNMAAGVDNIDLEVCIQRRIPVGHTPGVLTDGTADLTIAILLTIARQIPSATLDAKEGRWTIWSPTGWLGADLKGARLGIVGMGNIGQAVARRAFGFGMEIVYSSHTPKPEIDQTIGAAEVTLKKLITTSDFISLHVPLKSETVNLINKNELRKMKSSSYLINASRGPIVNTESLVIALKENWIAGAALDVTDPEPLPPDHPLYRLPNCLITPHIGSATLNTRRNMAELACINLLAGLKGEKLPHCVNPEVYE